MTTIEDGDGKQIDNGKIDIEQNQKAQSQSIILVNVRRQNGKNSHRTGEIFDFYTGFFAVN